MKRSVFLVTAALQAIALAGPVAAQTITLQQADQIVQELRAIRLGIDTLNAKVGVPPPAPAPDATVKLPPVTGHMLGKPDAPVTIVEFTDLPCPFCSRFSNKTFEELKKAYIETGQVRFVTRDFPLEPLHPFAVPAAKAARCAGDQGRFWDVREALVKNADKLSAGYIAQTAKTAGLNMTTFDQCVASDKYTKDIQADRQQALSIGISGTPSFVVGRTTSGGFEGARLVGAQPLASFEAKIREALGPAGK